MVDIQTVGAGGGSIAWFDRGGLLKVGPASAGAVPGPACYGRGGGDPTVSDANLLLGRLGPRGLLGGRMALDGAAAVDAMAPVAARLDRSAEQAAHGVIGIVVANMVRAVRAVSVERGFDPRDFALLAMGGAGPLHASDVARALGIGAVIVPPAPGILCAQGLVLSDLREDFVTSGRYALTAESLPALRSGLDALAQTASGWAGENDVAESDYRLSLSFDMRYIGQNFELRVPVSDAAAAGELLSLPTPADLRQRFFAAHEQSYGFHDSEAEVEIVNLRLTAHGRVAKPVFARVSEDDATLPPPIERRAVWFDAEGPAETPVYDRPSLRPGNALAGPAVVEQLDATTLVFPGDTLRVDGAGNLLLEIRP
jgi:N-methylhydantoinase A